MTLDLTDIEFYLENGVPPEITHFQKGVHPGRHWWLKTVVPHSKTSEIYQYWLRLHQAHGHRVWLTHSAFDWLQAPIPDAATVWIQQGFNVILSHENHTISHETVRFDQSFNQMGSQLTNCIDPAKFSDPGWHKLTQLTDFISTWTTHSQAVARRKTFTRHHNEKDSGSCHQ